jgi:hypothetical protein
MQYLLAATDRPHADSTLFSRVLFRMFGHLDGYVCVELACYVYLPFETCGTDQSRRCPLCAQGIGEYLIHNIRSKYDYTKYFLPPLRSNSPTPFAVAAGSSSSNQRRARRERRWGQRERRAQEEQDRLERSIKRRKWVYGHHLYAKVNATDMYDSGTVLTTDTGNSMSRPMCTRGTSRSLRRLSLQPLQTTSVGRQRSCGASCKCGRTSISKSVFRTFHRFY